MSPVARQIKLLVIAQHELLVARVHNAQGAMDAGLHCRAGHFAPGFIEQGQRGGLHALAHGIWVVSSFERHDERNILAGRFEQAPCHDVIHVTGQAAIAQQIALGGIETTSNNDQIGIKGRQDWQNHLGKGGSVFRVAHAALSPDNVEIGSGALAVSGFIVASRARIEPVLGVGRATKGGPVNGEVENVGVVVGEVLDPVAVMNVPI